MWKVRQVLWLQQVKCLGIFKTSRFISCVTRISTIIVSSEGVWYTPLNIHIIKAHIECSFSGHFLNNEILWKNSSNVVKFLPEILFQIMHYSIVSIVLAILKNSQEFRPHFCNQCWTPNQLHGIHKLWIYWLMLITATKDCYRRWFWCRWGQPVRHFQC